jgi:SAM-dependent methyltransferase
MVQSDLSRNVVSIRAKLVAAQEEMLSYAASAWQLQSIPFRDVLDVGCGLGGGAILWAQGFGARVTAITIAPSHVGFVAKFSLQAGVESLVTPLLCDALTVPGEHCYDAVIAIDSSSSFPRRPWFDRLATLLRPGGHVFIFDCFLGCDEYADPFNRHWYAQIGTLEEYLLRSTRGLQTANDRGRFSSNPKLLDYDTCADADGDAKRRTDLREKSGAGGVSSNSRPYQAWNCRGRASPHPAELGEKLTYGSMPRRFRKFLDSYRKTLRIALRHFVITPARLSR